MCGDQLGGSVPGRIESLVEGLAILEVSCSFLPDRCLELLTVPESSSAADLPKIRSDKLTIIFPPSIISVSVIESFDFAPQ